MKRQENPCIKQYKIKIAALSCAQSTVYCVWTKKRAASLIVIRRKAAAYSDWVLSSRIYEIQCSSTNGWSLWGQRVTKSNWSPDQFENNFLYFIRMKKVLTRESIQMTEKIPVAVQNKPFRNYRYSCTGGGPCAKCKQTEATVYHWVSMKQCKYSMCITETINPYSWCRAINDNQNMVK